MDKTKRPSDPAALARSRVRDILAYHVEQTPSEVILDANESPYPPPPELHERLMVIMAGTALNRYPDMEATLLRRALARKDGVDEHEILPGNGSDEAIQSLIAALCDPGDRVLTPTPTFSMYRIIANWLNVECVETPLGNDWSLDVERVIDDIARARPKIVFIATPNNPTGARYPDEAVKAVIEASPGAVVVDEAYIDYAARPYGLLFRDRPNVLILRTLSKVGFAALRLGYLMGDRRLLAEVNKTRLPYNINSVTQAAAAEAANSWSLVAPSFKAVAAERERMAARLAAIPGVTAFPSQANFILMRIARGAEDMFNTLLREGVRVRWFKGAARLDDCFRVTVGTPLENDRFLAALETAMRGPA
ncbi:MAG: histidinol-phosphate transaminase [Nitrospinae bacterium]|nr:histidinol-phosphate transaminase [Nitrospinota bacterium]